jgi:hypothetical protein
MSRLKTIDELRALANRALKRDFEQHGTPTVEEAVQKMWINGFMAGYLHCQMDEINERSEKFTVQVIGDNSDNA